MKYQYNILQTKYLTQTTAFFSIDNQNYMQRFDLGFTVKQKGDIKKSLFDLWAFLCSDFVS